MDQDDPEKRIADLERQLAEPRAGGDRGENQGYKSRSAFTTGGCLTPEDVHKMAFSKPPLGKRGYSEDEVDAFLDLVGAALRDPPGNTLTPEDVRDVAFSKPPLGGRGYNEDEVDAFLDIVEQQMKSRQAAFPRPPQAGFPPTPEYPRRRPSTNAEAIAQNVGTVLGIVLCFAIVAAGIGLIVAFIISGTVIAGLIAVRLANRLQGRPRKIARASIVVAMIIIIMLSATVVADFINSR